MLTNLFKPVQFRSEFVTLCRGDLNDCVGGNQSTLPLDGPLKPPSDNVYSALTKEQTKIMTVDGKLSPQSFYDYVLGLYDSIK